MGVGWQIGGGSIRRAISAHLGLSVHNDGSDQTSLCAHSNAHINAVVPGGPEVKEPLEQAGIGPT